MNKAATDSMLEDIITVRPRLADLTTDTSILEYYRPAVEWSQHANVFPQTAVLQSIIIAHIERLYGMEIAKSAKDQLASSWVVETGAHLHIPRRYENVGRAEGPQINSLLFQGQVLWALSNKSLGRTISLSLNSGRVPLDNTNSGAYLDLPALKLPITLASKKKHPDSPQSLIPARTSEEIQEKRDLLDMYKKQKTLPEDQYIFGQKILENFQKVQSSFSDQVATSHALLLNTILPIQQITLDSEFIGRDLAIALLKDKTSLTYAIFSDIHKRTKFLHYLGDIRTGWTNDSSPFYSVAEKGEGYRLTSYTGDLSPETIVEGLEQKTLWLTGVMKYFIMMVESGMLPVGGWTQAGYCTEIKVQAAKLLRELGLEERADLLEQMPTSVAAVAPCWGLDEVDGRVQLIDAITTLLNPSVIDFTKITQLTSKQTFLIAAPTLYGFLLGKEPEPNYNQLKESLSFAIWPQH